MRLALLTFLLCAQVKAAGIGVIDLEAVLAASQQADRARVQWQEELGPIQAEIARIIEKGQAAELLAQDMGQSADTREEARNRMRQLQSELVQRQTQANELLQTREREFLNAQLPLLEALVIELAESRNLDLVIHADTVIWGRPKVNLSDDLLRAFEQAVE